MICRFVFVETALLVSCTSCGTGFSAIDQNNSMKTLLAGMVLGLAAKALWDSQYGDDMRENVNKWWNRVTGKIDQGIVTVTTKVENTASKVDEIMNR